MNTSWSNTALVAYSLLPKIVREIDSAVNSRVNSAFKSRHLQIGVSTEQLIGEIISLIDEKRKLVNMRYLVNSTLDMLNQKEKEIISARMLKKLTFEQITQTLNISMRTAFRRLDLALRSFELALARRGYTERWFEKEYGCCSYVSNIRKRLENDSYFIVKNA